ncbi:hypothetical protein AB8U03_10285 [Clostridium sp. Mt-5]|uniref:Uncharacterized protein n=1 Tax=Clostridium moutaii TaxID=3240932 RepID=A0ABV4BP74_9CLOT
MEVYEFEYENCNEKVYKKSHTGVVGPKNLEVIIEPNNKDNVSKVTIRTGIVGEKNIYKNIMNRFFKKHPVSVDMKINDSGNTPGIIEFRILEALEESKDVIEG